MQLAHLEDGVQLLKGGLRIRQGYCGAQHAKRLPQPDLRQNSKFSISGRTDSYQWVDTSEATILAGRKPSQGDAADAESMSNLQVPVVADLAAVDEGVDFVVPGRQRRVRPRQLEQHAPQRCRHLACSQSH